MGRASYRSAQLPAVPWGRPLQPLRADLGGVAVRAALRPRCSRLGLRSATTVSVADVAPGAVALVEGFLIVVFVLVVFHGQAPRGVLLARLCAALSARLDFCLDRLHGSLQITRLFEAAMTSLFHDELPSRDVLVRKQSLQPSPREGGSAAGARTMGSMAQDLDIDAMLNRFRERARAVRQRGLPPIEGAERKRFMDQARTDYMDYAMIGDATATLENGILTLRVDLRPESARG
jgi:hypothetical protein